jgi:O-antigen ligase
MAPIFSPAFTRRDPRSLVIAFGVAVALAVGAGSALAPKYGIGIAIAAALGFTLVRWPTSILFVMVGSVFIEIVAIGGLTFARLLAPVALVITAAALLKGRASFAGGGTFLWVLAYSAWALASGLWTVSLSGTVHLLGSLAIALTFLLAFGALIGSARELRRTYQALAVVALTTSVFAIVTFAAGATARSSAAKGDPNSFAAYELIALPLVLLLASETANPRIRLGLYATSLAIIGAVMTSLSRGGLLTLAALLLLLGALPARMMFRSGRQKAVVLALVVTGTAIAFYSTAPELTARIDQVFTTAGHSGSGRLDLWKGAVTSIKQRPALGLGFGAFSSVSTNLLLQTPGVDLVDFEPSRNGDLAHSAYLETLAELGIPGLVLFLGVLGSTAVSLRGTARRARAAGVGIVERSAHGLLIGLFAWAIAAAFLSLETARPLWILIGLALALPKVLEAERRRRQGAASPRSAAAEAPLARTVSARPASVRVANRARPSARLRPRFGKPS